MSNSNGQQKELQITDSTTPTRDRVPFRFPTKSVTPGARAIFKFDEKKGWVLEFYGSKVAGRRSLEDHPYVKIQKSRKELEYKWKVYERFVSGILATIIKNIKGI